MTTKKSSRLILLRIAAIAPMIASLFVSSEATAHPANHHNVSSPALFVTQSTRTQQPEQVLITAEKMPRFQNGDLNKFRNWIQSQIIYPKDAQQGKIEGMTIVYFVIRADGKLVDITVIKSAHPSLDAEAIRILESSPMWTPGQDSGKNVSIKHTMPIRFSLP